MRRGEGPATTAADVTQLLLSLEVALVVLLYLSLLTEIISIARGRYFDARDEHSQRQKRPPRPAVRHLIKKSKKSSGRCHEKKRIRSLDNLWRRMQKATNQMRLVNLKHHVITKVMMESRMQAREREREKFHQKQEKLFAGIITPVWGVSPSKRGGRKVH